MDIFIILEPCGQTWLLGCMQALVLGLKMLPSSGITNTADEGQRCSGGWRIHAGFGSPWLKAQYMSHSRGRLQQSPQTHRRVGIRGSSAQAEAGALQQHSGR